MDSVEAQDALQNQNALLEARVAERTAELEASREALRAKFERAIAELQLQASREAAQVEGNLATLQMLRRENDAAEAAREVEQSDEAHGAIIRRHFHADWRDPELYDLTLNTERVSISHCVDVWRPFEAWPAMVARQHSLELTNVALAGQCQLDPFMGRVIRDAPADVISLKLGINLVNANSMTERTFGPAVHGLLDHVRDGHRGVPVLVVSPIFCPLRRCATCGAWLMLSWPPATTMSASPSAMAWAPKATARKPEPQT